jgi:cbb3-type cytochrome oxidase maturation protein
MLKSILVLIILSLFLGTAAWLFFIWAVKKGSFDDVEGPKYRMLEDDDEAGPPDLENNTYNNKSTP